MFPQASALLDEGIWRQAQALQMYAIEINKHWAEELKNKIKINYSEN